MAGSAVVAEGRLGAHALNIISRPGAARPDTASVGAELARLLGEGALELPPWPAGAATVASLSGPAPSRGRELAGIIAADQRLQSRLMLVGRQAAADPSLGLDTPQDIIGWIGPAEAGDIVYTASLQDALFDGCPGSDYARGLWQVGIAAAIWSREAAALARRRSRHSYACGLLHDVARPLTALACARLAAQLDVALDAASVAQLVHEHHRAVASLAAGCWALPEPVRQCLQGWPDSGEAGPAPRERPVVYLGRHLAELVTEQGPEFAREALASDPVLDQLNIGPDRFRGLVNRAAWVAGQVGAY